MSEYGICLFPQHQELLRASGVDPEVARERGYVSVDTKVRLQRIRFADYQRSVPGLLIPIHGVDGQVRLHQYRPDTPRTNGDGKAVKYETPARAKLAIDVHPRVRKLLSDPSQGLLITEGTRKADAAVSKGAPCIALPGVWAWMRDGKPLPDWDDIELHGRDVTIAFDSDVLTKEPVQAALQRLTDFLVGRGAQVFVANLPPGPNGEKTGLDDYLGEHTPEDLLNTAVLAQTADQRRLDQLVREERLRRTARRLVDEEEAVKSLPDNHPFAQRLSTAELATIDLSFQWLVRRVLTRNTFALLGGPEKSLKSYLGLILAVAVAGGRKWLGEFWVDEPAPVLIYVGEGGVKPFVQRLARVAKAMGFDWTTLPIHVRAGSVPVLSPAFQALLRRDLEEVRPGLVWVDPWYAYAGGDIASSQLNEVGEALTALSDPCTAAGAVLLLNVHFNQGGQGVNLKRTSGAGLAEWADTWLLVDPDRADVERGEFTLLVTIGSRQWGGGQQWIVDLTTGRFDHEVNEYVGAISWSVKLNDGSYGGGKKTNEDYARQVAGDEILDVLSDETWKYTKTAVRTLLGGGKNGDSPFNQAWEALRKARQIVAGRGPVPFAAGWRTGTVWATAGSPLAEGVIRSDDDDD